MIYGESMDLVGAWANPSEKYDFVNWDDAIPNWMEISHGKITFMFQTTKQHWYISIFPVKVDLHDRTLSRFGNVSSLVFLRRYVTYLGE